MEANPRRSILGVHVPVKSNPLGLKRWLLHPLIIGLIATVAITLLVLFYFVVTLDLPAHIVVNPTFGMLVATAAMYGFGRGGNYHPIMRDDYATWLITTPWRPGLPLPLGPVHLVTADFVLIGVLTLASGPLGLFHDTLPVWISVVAPEAAFLGVASMLWLTICSISGLRWHGYAAAGTLVLAGILHVPIQCMILCPFVIAPIALHGALRSLELYPWRNIPFAPKLHSSVDRPLGVIGWPMKALLEKEPTEVVVPLRQAITEALLTGGCVWLAVHCFLQLNSTAQSSGDVETAVFFIPAVAALFLAAVRIGFYQSAICSMLCWGNRLANRTPLVWRHDRVLLIPFTLVVLGCSLPFLLKEFAHVPIGVAFAATAAIMIFLMRGAGSSVREALATGAYSSHGTSMTSGKDFMRATE